MPSFVGVRYEDDVPGTLDLAERMRLALQAMTRCVGGPPKNPFPRTHFLSNHFIDVTTFPPKVLRNVNLYGKHMLGVLLARMVTGDETRLDVDNDWRQAWIGWQRINPILTGPEGGRHLEWIAFNHLREEEPNKPAWKALGDRAVSRLREAAVDYRDGAFIGLTRDIPDEGFPNIEMAAIPDSAIENLRSASAVISHPTGWNATFDTWTVQGLCAYHRATGSAESLELAGRLARYLKDYAEVIASDGRLLAGHPHEWPVVHWHHSFQVAMACGEYGAASGDWEFLDCAQTVYRHVLTFCNPAVGFAPEYCYGRFPRKQNEENTEACCSSDLVLMALWLTEAGVGACWDDIDRYIRNHITALQLTGTKWVYEIPENRDKWTYPDPGVETAILPLVGQFGGWATANEWHDPHFGPGIMTCCVGNCTRAFYYVWSRMLEYRDGELRVHLMLNRASPWADVKSHSPYEGKLEINLKVACNRVLVRAPEWIQPDGDEITATRDGEQIPLVWAGRYLNLGPGEPWQSIALTYPVPTRSVETSIGGKPYTLTLKGNTVIGIDPPGQRIPLYQRGVYRAEKAPLVRVGRYVRPVH
jgi:SAM-dependent methyltransferase